MTAQPVIRVATPEDIAAYYGAPPKRTMRAYVALLDGEPIGIAGLIYQPHPAPPYFFSEMKPAMRPFKKAMVRGARAMLEAIPARCPALVSSPRAARFLTRLGFERVGSHEAGEIFVYRGGSG